MVYRYKFVLSTLDQLECGTEELSSEGSMSMRVRVSQHVQGLHSEPTTTTS